MLLLTSNLAMGSTKLSWEKKNPKNSAWTTITLNAIRKDFEKFDKAQDIKEFCNNYEYLEKGNKILAWGELISAISFYESSWNPEAFLEEPTLGIDAVTGKKVRSQGLMQISYGDTKWARWCNLKNGGITNPKNNLECAIGILANQIDKHEHILLGRGAYWSVIKNGSRYNKIEGIKSMVNSLEICNATSLNYLL